MEAEEACITNEVTLTKMNCFLDDAFHSSCEGLMIKSLDVEAGYTPSKRSDSWLKVSANYKKIVRFVTTILNLSYLSGKLVMMLPLQVKRDYVEGLTDTLDLVPIGAWYGNGRKAGW